MAGSSVPRTMMEAPADTYALRVSLLGCPRVCPPGKSRPAKIGRPARSLLAYLLLSGRRPHARDKLAGSLWSTQPRDSADHSLRTALWRLRQAIEPPETVTRGTYLIVTATGDIGFNWSSRFWFDVGAFEETINHVDTAASRLAGLEWALELYEGDLLEGVFDDWVLCERERLRQLYIKGLIRIMHALSDVGRYQAALTYGRKVLALDPLRESAHRQMMRLYAATGDRCQALAQYRDLSRLLEDDLHVAPSQETTSVYSEILQMKSGVNRSALSSLAPAELKEIARQLESGLEQLEDHRAMLNGLMDKVRALLEDAPRSRER